MFEAVQCAEKAVQLSVTWATARQTLGRAQLGIGEVHMVSTNRAASSPSTLQYTSAVLCRHTQSTCKHLYPPATKCVF